MSFFNTIRGFGRTSKKNKKDLEPPSLIYSHPNGSGSPIRRNQSPTKYSPSKQRLSQMPYSNIPLSPTKRTRQMNLPQGRPQNLHPNIIDPENPPLFLCEPFVKTALVKGSFKTIVQLPKYVDYGEWLALNIFEFFNHLNQFYGVVSDYVTPESFPTMNAGSNTTYYWIDSSGKPINLPANQYIDYVLTWISNKINDQSVFPTKSGGAFPQTFLKDCKNISRQMFRIFAFIYHNQFETILHLSLESHWNSFFAHFINFVREFSLIDNSELAPLAPLIDAFEQQGKIMN